MTLVKTTEVIAIFRDRLSSFFIIFHNFANKTPKIVFSNWKSDETTIHRINYRFSLFNQQINNSILSLILIIFSVFLKDKQLKTVIKVDLKILENKSRKKQN